MISTAGNSSSAGHRKHGLALREGISVIANPLNQSEIQFENGEEGERIIGHAAGNAVLVVVFHVEDDEDADQTMPIIRLISVRTAERSERRRMQMQEDVKPNEPPKAIDPDNPPLTGKEVWRPWGERVQEIIKNHDAKVAARKIDKECR